MIDVKINEKLVKYNFSSRNGEKVKYIVIHDTGNTRKGADSEAHFSFFNSGDKQSSAHYFVDDKQILRIIRETDKSWHCGDGKGRNGISNDNSIGIEICINPDGDYNKAFNEAVRLSAFLLQKYSLGIDKLVRHYDASGKICPNTMKNNNWAKWIEFKKATERMLINKSPEESNKDYKEFIREMYDRLLDREPDSEGLNYWNNEMKKGISYGDLLRSIGDSQEFKGLYII